MKKWEYLGKATGTAFVWTGVYFMVDLFIKNNYLDSIGAVAIVVAGVICTFFIWDAD